MLKREDAKRREESNGLLKIALDEISSHQKVLQQPSSPKQLDSFDRDVITDKQCSKSTSSFIFIFFLVSGNHKIKGKVYRNGV